MYEHHPAQPALERLVRQRQVVLRQLSVHGVGALPFVNLDLS